jgi:membrane protein implicated in regulation of membrane protease activity
MPTSTVIIPSTTLIWFIIGTLLCLTEVFVPTAFFALMMGLSALVVALLSSVVIGKLWLQVVVWLLLSTFLVFLSRRFMHFPRRRHSKIQDAIVAETLTEIAAGKTGRVLYEGNSWRARCDDDKLTIAAHERVYVTRREGTTLIVMPENVLHS